MNSLGKRLIASAKEYDVRCVTGDTDLTPVDLGSYSSRVTLIGSVGESSWYGPVSPLNTWSL